MSQQKSVIDVNQATFQADVVQRSHSIPIIVDFWAPWCGPCRMLGPILERLASEANSGFLLAKVNSDHNQQISMQYGIRGIPAVKAFVNGKVVDEFVGAQPEPMVRQFIQRVIASHQPQTSQSQPQAKSQPSPVSSDPSSRLNQARELLRKGKGCEAESQLKGFPASPQAEAAGKLLPLAQFLCQMSRGAISGGPADLGVLYRQVADAVNKREYATAMYNLLAILNQDSGYQGGQAKVVMNSLFDFVGQNDPLTQAYQQQMIRISA